MNPKDDSITVHEGTPPSDEWATPGTLRRTRPLLDDLRDLERQLDTEQPAPAQDDEAGR